MRMTLACRVQVRPHLDPGSNGILGGYAAVEREI